MTLSPRTALLACIAAAGALAPAHAARAQTLDTKPVLHMPVACGQTWTARADANWTDKDAITLTETADGANVGAGEPVLASAAGKVVAYGTNTTREGHWIQIDHGFGWSTVYRHLESASQLAFGRRVAQGEQIGRVGSSGNVSQPTLGYAQLSSGTEVRAEFDDTAIATWSGAPSSVSTLTSLNCSGNAFADVAHYEYDSNDQLTDHRTYQMLYKPGTGRMVVGELDEATTGMATRHDTTWSKGWTHIEDFWVVWRDDYFIAYKSATGQAVIGEVKHGGAGLTTLAAMTFSKGWTHLVPMRAGTTNTLITYNSVTGTAALSELAVTSSSASSTKLWSTDWGTGWTHLVPFRSNGEQFLLAYNASNGAANINRLASNHSFAQTWSGTLPTGLTHIAAIAENRLLMSNANTGSVRFATASGGSAGITHTGSATWTRGWTALTPVEEWGDRLFAYKAGAGTAAVDRIHDPFTGTGNVWTQTTWSLGWT